MIRSKAETSLREVRQALLGGKAPKLVGDSSTMLSLSVLSIIKQQSWFQNDFLFFIVRCNWKRVTARVEG